MGFFSNLFSFRKKRESAKIESGTVNSGSYNFASAASTNSKNSYGSGSNSRPSHRFDSGRRFHDIEDVSYMFPNDDEGTDFTNRRTFDATADARLEHLKRSTVFISSTGLSDIL